MCQMMLLMMMMTMEAMMMVVMVMEVMVVGTACDSWTTGEAVATPNHALSRTPRSNVPPPLSMGAL